MYTDYSGYSSNDEISKKDFVYDQSNLCSISVLHSRDLFVLMTDTNQRDLLSQDIDDYWQFNPKRARQSLVTAGVLVGLFAGFSYASSASFAAIVTGFAVSVGVVLLVAVVIYVIATIVVNASEEVNEYE
jgi:hypothetical protein